MKKFREFLKEELLKDKEFEKSYYCKNKGYRQ